jgi:hypothetical protein
MQVDIFHRPPTENGGSQRFFRMNCSLVRFDEVSLAVGGAISRCKKFKD